MRFFHGSRSLLPEGAILDAKPRRTTPFEVLIESFRPANAHSRLYSFFLTSDPDEIELLGPAQRYFYEVAPMKEPTKVSFDWIEKLNKIAGCDYVSGHCNQRMVERNFEMIRTLAANYWNGEPTSYGFEYLSPQIFVVKRLSSKDLRKLRHPPTLK